MKFLSIGRAAVLSVMALVGSLAAVGSADAASAAWGSQTGGPTLYQSNWYYYSSYINPVGSVPPTAVVSSMPYSAGTSYIPSGLYVGICPSNAGGGCYWTSSVSGTIYPSDNRSANQAFRFGFYVARSSAQMLSPYVYGGVDNLVVNYNF